MLVGFLKDELNRRKKKNLQYSLRSFAKSLKQDPSALSKVLSRQRKPTDRFAKEVIKNLKLDSSTERLLLCSLIEKGHMRRLKDADFLIPNNEELMKYMSEWQFYALMSLVELPHVLHTKKDLAKALNSPESLISDMLNVLCRHQLLVRKNNRYHIQNIRLSLKPETSKVVHNRVMEQYLQKCIEYIKKDDRIENSQIGGFTLTMKKSKLPEAKNMIKQFSRDLAELLTGGVDEMNNDEVYRLHVHLFPLTNLKK